MYAAGSRHRAAGSGQRVAGSKQRAAGSRHRAAGSGQRVAGSRHRLSGPRQAAAGSRQRAAASQHRAALRFAILALALLPLIPDAPARAQAVRYVTRLANRNRVGLTVSNYGFFGNNFTSRSPSLEFPLGSGYEHMSRAGLWIGALAVSDSGAFTGVTSALVDATQGGASADETEFSPLGDVVSERSRIPNSRVYSPAAISDQDLICEYTDATPKRNSGNQREHHEPLKIRVRQVTLGFTLKAADAFVVARYVVTNDGAPLRDAWLGLYAQFASGNKNSYSVWPPSAGSGPGSWYFKAHIEFDPARRLFSERYCAAPPYPDNCRASVVPPWAGIKLLGTAPDSVGSKRVNWRWWTFAPGDTARDEDREKYRLLSEPQVDDGSGCALLGACSPIQLMSVGPFARIEHGDSVSFDVAFVAGEDQPSLLAHADYAQFAHDVDYRLPSAPPSPRLLVQAGSQRADLWWDDSPEFAVDPTSPAPGGRDFEGYRVYIGLDQQQPTHLAQYDLADTTGFNTGLGPALAPTPLVQDGITYRYRYRVTGLKDGFRYWGAVTSYDTGDPGVESLESSIGLNKFMVIPSANEQEHHGVVVFPNPYRVEALWDTGKVPRDKVVWFAGLPARCKITVYTLAGDKVMAREFDGSSYHTENVRGVWTPDRNADTGPPTLSGGTFAWDLITDRGQAAATGLYVWTVEDHTGGPVQRGKLLVVRSDRE